MLVQSPDVTPADSTAAAAPAAETPAVVPLSQSAGGASRWRMHVRRGLIAVGVVYLYLPNLVLIRLLGPRWGLVWSRWLAWLHWLFTFVGAQHELRRVLTRIHPHLDTRLSVSTLMRKHLELKHRSFAQWRLSVTPRGRELLKGMYTDFEGAHEMQRLYDEGNGIFVVGYHFGLYKLLTYGLSVTNNVPIYQVSYRSAHYAQHTLGPVARMALANAVATDRRSKMRNIYVSPDATPISVASIIKRLRRGNIVGIAGDGAVSSDFVDVSFLGGTIAMPNGWARLAAHSNAPIVIMFDTLEDDGQHKISVSRPLYCQEDSPEAVRAVVQEAASILESFVRRQPWAWHLWHRIEFLSKPDEQLRMRINPRGGNHGLSLRTHSQRKANVGLFA